MRINSEEMLPQTPAKRDKKPKKQKKEILIRMLTCKIEHVKPKSTKEHPPIIISSLKDDYIINVNGYNFNFTTICFKISHKYGN